MGAKGLLVSILKKGTLEETLYWGGCDTRMRNGDRCLLTESEVGRRVYEVKGCGETPRGRSEVGHVKARRMFVGSRTPEQA